MCGRYLCEVLPASGAKVRASAAFIDENDPLLARDAADAGDGNPRDANRDTFPGGQCEEKFVVFAAIEGYAKINRSRLSPNPRARNGVGRDFCTHSRFFADVGEIGGEAVAQIDHRRGEMFFAQNPAHGNSWNGREVSWKVLRTRLSSSEEFRESGGRSAESAGYVDLITRHRPGPQNCLPFRHSAEYNDIGTNTAWRFGGISPRQNRFELGGGF